MNVEKEREKIGKFIKAGLVGLSFVLLIGCAFLYIPKAVSTYREDKQVKEMPIHSVECQGKKIALSFDVSGSDKELTDILKLLNRHGVKATFFLTGKWINDNPDMVKKIYDAGHDVGNHSQNHKEMSGLSRTECEMEIEEVHKKVRDLIGVDMNLFRAPYDEFDDTTLEVTKSMGYYPIEWNVDSLDWKDYGIDPIINEICNSEELKEGSIILCHTGTKFTKKALDKVISTLQKRGYDFEKVSDLIYKTDYHIDNSGRQIRNLE